MNGRCVIFAAGEKVSRNCADVDFIGRAYVIAADGGTELAADLGVMPDRIIGDFDSCGHMPDGNNVEVYPCEKDDTDLMLAIKAGLKAGCRDFQIYGAAGGRLDHMIGNIQSLAFLLGRGAHGCIISDREYVTLLSPGRYFFTKRGGFSLSLFAYSEKAEGLCIRGVKYAAEDCELSSDFPLGISNIITADRAEVSFKKGRILVICSRLFTDP